jgi:hypothetical protein
LPTILKLEVFLVIFFAKFQSYSIIFCAGLVIGWTHLVIDGLYLFGLFCAFIYVIFKDCNIPDVSEEIPDSDRLQLFNGGDEMSSKVEDEFITVCTFGKSSENFDRKDF